MFRLAQYKIQHQHGAYNMKLFKLGFAIVFGFVLGGALFRSPRAKAIPQQSGQVHVAIVPVTMLDAKNLASQTLPDRIAGISCIPKPEKRLPDAAVCYVATSSQ